MNHTGDTKEPVKVKIYLLFVHTSQSLPLVVVVGHHSIGEGSGQLAIRGIFFETDNFHEVLCVRRVKLRDNHGQIGDGEIHYAGSDQEVKDAEPCFCL